MNAQDAKCRKRFSLKISPFGRSFGSHQLRYKGFAADDYSCTLASSYLTKEAEN